MSLKKSDHRRGQVLDSRPAKARRPLPAPVVAIRSRPRIVALVATGAVLLGSGGTALIKHGIYPRFVPGVSSESAHQEENGTVSGSVSILTLDGILYAEAQLDSLESSEVTVPQVEADGGVGIGTMDVTDPTAMQLKSFVLTVDGEAVVAPLVQAESLESTGFLSRTRATACVPDGALVEAAMIFATPTDEVPVSTSWISDGECNSSRWTLGFTEPAEPTIEAGIGI